jgi:polynucleotide 5'-hydroxyl-kinase GRC3/NOL9
MVPPHPQLDAVLAAVNKVQPSPVLFLGAVDTGKTTLLRQTASALAKDGAVVLVDADVGQSWIGPPTTVGRVRILGPRKRWTGLAPERIAFLGATSPAPSPSAAARALVDLAALDADDGDRVLIDTPGLMTGPLADSLWQRVAEGLAPPLVVAVHRGGELVEALRPFRRADIRVLEVAPAPGVRRRNRAERTRYRAAAYRRYFRDARLRRLKHETIRVRSSLPSRPAPLERGRLASLRDADGRDRALAVVRETGPKRLGVLTPLEDRSGIRTLVLGTFRLDPEEGREEYPDAEV